MDLVHPNISTLEMKHYILFQNCLPKHVKGNGGVFVYTVIVGDRCYYACGTKCMGTHAISICNRRFVWARWFPNSSKNPQSKIQ